MPGKALVIDANILVRAARGLVALIGSEVQSLFESTARKRLGDRDQDAWPILAAALTIGCPIWTEHTDFVRPGVPTWTASRACVFLREAPA